MEFGVAQAVPGDFQLGFGVINLRLGGLQAFLRVIELGPAYYTSGQEILLPSVVIACLGQLTLRSRQGRLRRA
jgi:hypothetical protein